MSSVITQTCGCLHQHVGDRLELGLGVGGAGRVRRRVEDDPLGARRDRLLQRLRLHLEAVLHARRHDHRLAAGEQHHVRIADPVRRRDDDLVAGVERHHQRVVEHLLAAGRDDDLVRLVVEVVLALELADDRLLELRQALDRGVLRRPAALDRLDRRLLDVVRRVEVGLAGAEPDDVAARRFERARLVGHRHGGGGLDARQRVLEQGHENLRAPRGREVPNGPGRARQDANR